MRNESILSKLVRNEDSYTQLLCNLMRRDEAFRDRILTFLFSGASIGQTSPHHIDIQKRIGADGRPDLIIDTGNIIALLEIKIDVRCDLTANQEVNGVLGDHGYARHLMKQRCEAKESWFVFIAPRDWVLWGEVERSGREILGPKGIHFKVVSWTDVLLEIGRGDSKSRHPLVEEFRLLLSARFGPIAFLAEEVTSMFSRNFPIRAVRKLDLLIEAIAAKAKGKYEIKWEKEKKTGAKAGTEEDYGFYIKEGKHSLLYFGCYTEFWETYGYPICFGIDDKWEIDTPGLKKAFAGAWTGDTKVLNSCTMGYFSKEDIGDNDPADRIWRQVELILKRLREVPSADVVVSADAKTVSTSRALRRR